MIQLLHLYDDLLDLYGDSGNLTMLAYRLKEAGHEVTIRHCSKGDTFDLTGSALVYIGPGRTAHLAAAGEDLLLRKNEVLEAVEAGVPFLVTGNARLLFGRSFEDAAHGRREGLGLFAYEGAETGEVYVRDMVCEFAQAHTPAYGMINRTSCLYYNDEADLTDPPGTVPLFLPGGAEIGIDYIGAASRRPLPTEGLRYNNFFSTWALGPVLVKNPVFCRTVLEIICTRAGEEMPEVDDALETKALALTLEEFG